MTSTATLNGSVKATPEERQLTIRPVNFQKATVRVIGTAPYCQGRFSEEAKAIMRGKMEDGPRARTKRERKARDFDADFKNALHLGRDGKYGIPAPSFRNAIISACKLAGFAMTRAKLSVFVIEDSLDALDGTPLVHINGDPEKSEMYVRNQTGVADIRVRGLWTEWSADVRLKWDADQLSQDDVINLLDRAGQQVGIGAGRPDSRESNGIGFGTFEVERAVEGGTH